MSRRSAGIVWGFTLSLSKPQVMLMKDLLLPWGHVEALVESHSLLAPLRTNLGLFS